MRDFRFSAFLLVLSSVAWTQATNATTQQPAVVQAPAQTAATAPPAPADREFRAGIQPGMIERKLVDPFQVAEHFRKEMDRGIRLNPAGAGMCGSIVSYNFSPSAPGEIPHLESVTTCTPADKVVERHAQNPRTKPSAPRLLKTSVPQR